MSFSTGFGPSITCPNCQRPFATQIHQIIDVGRDPSAKARLLSGQNNTAVCPHCGYRLAIGTPLLYHDPAKQLLLVYVPMELGLPQAEQERVIGGLMKALMDGIPNEQRRGYLFQPRPVLSMQGLIEAILEADGVTPEMLAAQRAKARLVETFLQADSDALPDLVAQHDDTIDMEFFQIISAAAQNALQAGREDMARHIMDVRDRLMALSTAGRQAIKELELQEQAIQDVAQALTELGQEATREDFLDLVIGFADDDQRLQALVGLQFPLFDYAFFQELAGRIEQADDGEKTRLETLRDRLLELASLIRQRQEMVVRAATRVLRDILSSEDMDAAIRRNLPLIDETFLMVLLANIGAAEDKKDVQASARLKQVYDRVLEVLDESAPPELRFINELLQQPSVEEARALVDARAAGLGQELLQYMDMLMQDLAARGDQRTLDRLMPLRDYVADVLGQPAS